MLYKDAANRYQTASENSSKTRQVVMLYEGILKFLNNAKFAIRDNNIVERYNNIEKAVEIINGLQLSLDLEKGGEVAEQLNKFYNTMISKLCFVNIKNESEESVEFIIQQFKPLKDAWEEVDRQHSAEQMENKQSQSPSADNAGSGIGLSI
jgi:flagellar secretion chaperone FliS